MNADETRAALKAIGITAKNLYISGYHDHEITIVLGEDITFDLLDRVSTALHTRSINVETETNTGYYGDISAYLTLTVRWS